MGIVIGNEAGIAIGTVTGIATVADTRTFLLESIHIPGPIRMVVTMAARMAVTMVARTVAITAALATLAIGNKKGITTDSIGDAKTRAAADIQRRITQSISGTAMQHTARDLPEDTKLDIGSIVEAMADIDT